MIPVKAGEQRIVDAVVALLPEASVAIAADDAATIASLPRRFVAFSRADYRAGKPPAGWMRSLSSRDSDGEPERRQERETPPPSHATLRLQAVRSARTGGDADALTNVRDELAWYRASSLGFAVLIVSGAGVAPARLKTALASSLRSGDSLVLQQDDCIAVLPGGNAEFAKRIASRALAAASKRLRIARAALKCGIAICPDDGNDAETLLAAARTHM